MSQRKNQKQNQQTDQQKQTKRKGHQSVSYNQEGLAQKLNQSSLKINEEPLEFDLETRASSKVGDSSLKQEENQKKETKDKDKSRDKSQKEQLQIQEPQLQSIKSSKVLAQAKAINEDSRENTKVICRFRPMNEQEAQLQLEKNCKLEFPFPNSVDITQDNLTESFTLDRIFPMSTSQSEMFDYLGQQMIKDILEGFNGTIFAYGQTGAGKTFTMMGPDIYDEQLKGVIPRAIQSIFDLINQNDQEVEYTLRCQMLEIYRENLRDLINPGVEDLKIKESPLKGIYIEGLSEICVVSNEEMLQLIEYGNQNRMVAATNMNKQSSRSHSIFILQVMQKSLSGSEKNGVLNLVDLAGSEKISKTKVEKENLEEAKKINLSLSALGNVIHALTKNSDHVPYRDSKLTRLLQQSLGGNFKTSLIVACSPHPYNLEETINTLKFATRAKSIKNKPRKNIKRSPAYYIKIIQQLKEELEALKGQASSIPIDIDNIEDNKLIEFNEDSLAKIQNLTSEVDNLTLENSELKQKVQNMEQKLEKQSLQVIEAENKLLHLKFQADKAENEKSKYQQQVENLLQIQKHTD